MQFVVLLKLRWENETSQIGDEEEGLVPSEGESNHFSTIQDLIRKDLCQKLTMRVRGKIEYQQEKIVLSACCFAMQFHPFHTNASTFVSLLYK